MWYNKAEIFGPREYRERCLHRSAIRQAAGGPMTSIGPNMCDVACLLEDTKIQVWCKGHAALRVTTENTARAMGSGELPVLATPAVAALVEKTCWQAIAPELELGMTTVGTSLQLAHTAPTPIGMVVQCDCEVLEVTDRRVRFGFRVYDDVTEVAGGEHERSLVDAERFLKKAESKI